MKKEAVFCDGLCRTAIRMPARQLMGLVCVMGGARCPLIGKQKADAVLRRIRRDPTAAIRLESKADEVPLYSTVGPRYYAGLKPTDLLNNKRDLDVLQRLGLCPGDTRRARYLYELLFQRIETPRNICAFDTSGWEGCALAGSGAYESVRARGWKAVVYCRSDKERADFRRRSAERIDKGGRIYIRPHHLMCLSCWYAGGKGQTPRSNDTLFEILQRVRREPDVPVTLVEGCCSACECCDGFHPANGRCVHAGGLIRDYKKDLDCFQKLGLMPGATLPARQMFTLLFERIPSTKVICGYGDGVVRSEEWRICGGAEGNPGYELTRKTGVF